MYQSRSPAGVTRYATVRKQRIVNVRARKKSRKVVLFMDGGMVQSKPTEPEKKTDYGYGSVMDYLIEKKGGEKQQYENLMDVIAFHETGANQRLRPDAIQEITKEGKEGLFREGVGRGLFMFEAGDGAGGITAVNRTHNLYKRAGLEEPEWLKEAYKGKSLDASTLTPEQQKVLFIGNYMEHPKADLGKFSSGDVSAREFWGSYHHAGGATTNYDSFDESYKAWEKSKNK